MASFPHLAIPCQAREAGTSCEEPDHCCNDACCPEGCCNECAPSCCCWTICCPLDAQHGCCECCKYEYTGPEACQESCPDGCCRCCDIQAGWEQEDCEHDLQCDNCGGGYQIVLVILPRPETPLTSFGFEFDPRDRRPPRPRREGGKA